MTDPIRAKDWNPPADIDVVVPAGYWQAGASLIPPVAANRSRWFQEMREFYQGVRTVGAIRLNYFRRACEFYGNLLASFPPSVEGREQTNRAFAEALGAVGTDLTRYGTSLTATWREGDARKSMQIQPDNWFPLDNGDDAVFTWGPYTAPGIRSVGIHWVQEGRSEHWLTEGTNLKERIPSLEADIPFRLHVNNRPPIITASGVGTSMFPDMITLVSELEKRIASMSGVLQKHTNPLLLVIKDSMLDSEFDGTDGVGAAALQGELDDIMIADRIEDSDIMKVGHEYKDARFLTWDPQMQAAQAHREAVEDALFSTTSVPAALYASDRSILATGVAMRRLFVPTYVALETLRHRMRPVLADMAADWEGRPVSVQDLEWPNPLDKLDEQVILQGATSPQAGQPGSSKGIDGRTDPDGQEDA